MLRVIRNFLCLSGLVMSMGQGAHASKGGLALEDWLSYQEGKSWQLMQKNINPKGTLDGTVVASLSKHNPNYFYHWIRDAALVMDTLHSLDQSESAVNTLKAFARLSYLQQGTDAPGGLGEPKFHVNGQPFTGPWGRPQNDGPALRSIALIGLANQLLEEGDTSFVTEVLYSLTKPSVIKRDLEYVARNLYEPDFDLWEEVLGYHFFTRVSQRKALLLGAELAERLGDGGAARYYRIKATEISMFLDGHLNSGAPFIMATVGRAGGIDNKSGLDTSTVLALLYTDDGKDPYLSLIDARVQQNVATIMDEFARLYSINNTGKDTMGPGIGRYPEDTYDGYESRGLGNPWFLLNHGMAEYFYRVAAIYRNVDGVLVTGVNIQFFDMVYSMGGTSLPKVLEGADLAERLMAVGDMLMARSQRHAFPNGSLSEQFNRETGFSQGAPDLTWSHSSFLRAKAARDSLLD